MVCIPSFALDRAGKRIAGHCAVNLSTVEARTRASVQSSVAQRHSGDLSPSCAGTSVWRWGVFFVWIWDLHEWKRLCGGRYARDPCARWPMPYI